MDPLVRHALNLLKSDPHYLKDARLGIGTNNTVIGAIMSITTKRPRWACEHAVTEALTIIEENSDD